LDARLTEAQMAQMKAGNAMCLSVPAELAKRLAARDSARADLASATDVSAALEPELAGLGKNLSDYEGQVRRAASKVLAEEAERVANDLLIAQKRCGSCRTSCVHWRVTAPL
jgi:hypothetical protein